MTCYYLGGTLFVVMGRWQRRVVVGSRSIHPQHNSRKRRQASRVRTAAGDGVDGMVGGVERTFEPLRVLPEDPLQRWEDGRGGSSSRSVHLQHTFTQVRTDEPSDGGGRRRRCQ